MPQSCFTAAQEKVFLSVVEDTQAKAGVDAYSEDIRVLPAHVLQIEGELPPWWPLKEKQEVPESLHHRLFRGTREGERWYVSSSSSRSTMRGVPSIRIVCIKLPPELVSKWDWNISVWLTEISYRVVEGEIVEIWREPTMYESPDARPYPALKNR